MTDKEKRQERIKELHEKSIDELFNIAKYNDFRAAKKGRERTLLCDWLSNGS